MKTIKIFMLTLFICIGSVSGQQKYALAIHGGAGVMSGLKPEQLNNYKITLGKALDLGNKMLQDGTSATDVVTEVISLMEDSPLFNAGKGAVFTHKGKNELDASIMEGTTLNAGALAGARNIKNPIVVAREIMEHSSHVFLSGRGAAEFAKKQGLEIVSNRYFHTKSRHNALKRILKSEQEKNSIEKMGTVGCVVLDKNGNLAAGTSTGGTTNKKYGRIGDSPIIGAGTYADNKTCAVSCTGHGEYYIRLGFARDISALMEYKNLSVTEACREEIRKLSELKGTGGVIAVDSNGNVAMEFNTPGMFRGYMNSNGDKKIAIYNEN